jgi:RNA polymerase sigma-70 factor, ECF subfamily
MMEPELIGRLKNGDTRAYAQIIDSYQEKILNLCYAFTHNRQDAEDVTQEVFIEVFQSIYRFRGEAKLGTWINRIAVNRSLDLLRKKKRKKRMAQMRSMLSFHDFTEEPIASAEASPEYTFEQQERAHLLAQAVNALAENQRIAITLSNYRGYDNSEIAELMGLSVSAVVSLIHRAKKNLYQRLYSYYEKKL